jgi:4-carboxymuconolactone decarboxylase
MSDPETALRRLALSDERLAASILDMRPEAAEDCWLDWKTSALVRLAAVVTLDSAAASYHWGVGAAFAAGATDEEVVGTLMALAPAIGLVRVVRAARQIGLAMGHDPDLALESFDRGCDPPGMSS